MTVNETHRWYLDPALLTSGEGVGLLLQDPDPILTVLHIEVGLQAIPRVKVPQSYGEGAGSFIGVRGKLKSFTCSWCAICLMAQLRRMHGTDPH